MTRITDPDDAVREIGDGACVGIGGSINAGHPMALIRALIRRGPSNLTVTGLTSGLDVDLLIAAGVVGRVSVAYVGAEDLVGLPPALRWGAEEGSLEVWECEEGIHLASLRARALQLPYETWSASVGTAVEAHPLVERAHDAESGRDYLKVRPLEVDVALVWAEAADEDGNLLLWGPDFGDEALRNAATVRIAQVERIVPTESLGRHPDRVAPWAADVVVEAPLSTHPFAASSIKLDEAWLLEYADVVAKAREAGGRETLDRYLDEWIREIDGEAAYLERVGASRLLGLIA